MGSKISFDQPTHPAPQFFYVCPHVLCLSPRIMSVPSLEEIDFMEELDIDPGGENSEK